jgi:hypothetical protein
MIPGGTLPPAIPPGVPAMPPGVPTQAPSQEPQMGDLEGIQQALQSLGMPHEQLMAFLAGAGVNTVVKALRRLIGQPPSANTPHRAGPRIEGTPGGGPGITVAPQMAAHLAQQAGQPNPMPQPPQVNPLALLAQ